MSFHSVHRRLPAMMNDGDSGTIDGGAINSLTANVVRERQLFYKLLWARLYLPNFYPFTELDSWKNCLTSAFLLSIAILTKLV